MQNILNGRMSAAAKIITLQLSAVTVIVICLTAVKLIGGKPYDDVRKWYMLNFCSDTSVSEVLEEPSQPAIEESEVQATENKAETYPDIMNVVSVSAVKPVSVVYSGTALKNTVYNNTLYSPLKNIKITSAFGARDNPITDRFERHKGVDLSAPFGTEIYAAADGTVELACYSSSYGNYIIINHGEGLKTLYAHSSKLLVSKGQNVKKGEAIALVGSTGQSTAAHLHFEVILNGSYINPEWLIKW